MAIMVCMRAFLILLLAGCGVALPFLLKAAESLPKLEARTEKWSALNALVLAEAAALSYDSGAAEKIKTVLRCESVEMLSFPLQLLPKRFRFEEGEPGPQAFLAACPDHIIIAFRGTEINLMDLLTDAWAQPSKLSDTVPGQAHSGFVTTFLLLWPELKPRLEAARAKYKDAPLWIAGHSLGGALAVMCAAQVTQTEKWPVQGLITCGAPVTGDAAFHEALSAALGGRHWRVVHALDMVPLDLNAIDGLPFVSLPSELTLFQHGGESVWINADGTLSGGGMRATAKAALTFAKTWAQSGDWKPPGEMLERHSMGTAYLPALRALYKKQAAK
jgi:Lipase (class 3)